MCFAQELKDLVKRILVLNPAQRLGALKRGAADIREHPWFAGFDWKAFASGSMPAPYIPRVRHVHFIAFPYIDLEPFCVGNGKDSL